MNLDLTNKSALVCGSTQGIGEAIAHELALLGCKLVLFARNADKLRQVVTSLPHKGLESHTYMTADFAKPDEAIEALEAYLKTNKAPDILVNNTGGPAMGSLIEEDYSKFEAAFKAHIACSHGFAQRLVPSMKKKQYGRIINVVSTSVYMPIVGLGVSNTTRGAMASWAKTLSMELGGDGITVNNVLPGLTDTGRLAKLVDTLAERENRTAEEVLEGMENTIPAGRLGKASEIAAMAAFLATPAAAYVNGVSIAVDGGKTGVI